MSADLRDNCSGNMHAYSCSYFGHLPGLDGCDEACGKGITCSGRIHNVGDGGSCKLQIGRLASDQNAPAWPNRDDRRSHPTCMEFSSGRNWVIQSGECTCLVFVGKEIVNQWQQGWIRVDVLSK